MSRNRWGLSVHFSLADREKLFAMCEFFTCEPKELMKMAFNELHVAYTQLKKRFPDAEYASDIKQSVVEHKRSTGEAARADTAGADAAPAVEIVRDESTGNIVEQVVAGS